MGGKGLFLFFLFFFFSFPLHLISVSFHLGSSEQKKTKKKARVDSLFITVVTWPKILQREREKHGLERMNEGRKDAYIYVRERERETSSLKTPKARAKEKSKLFFSPFVLSGGHTWDKTTRTNEKSEGSRTRY